VNPLYVKSVREKKPGVTEVIGSFLAMGNTMQTEEAVADLADRISVALASMSASGFAAVETERQQQQAAAAAATAG